MRVVLLVALGLAISTCTMRVDQTKDDAAAEPPPPIAGATAEVVEPLSEEGLRLLAEAEEIERKLQAGEPITEAEVVSDLSAYQRGQLEKTQREERGLPPAWLLLARQTYSEGSNDMEALLQMALNLASKWETSLPEAIARRAPHVSQRADFTRERQRMTSTLPARGKKPGELWWECDEILRVKVEGKTRWKGVPDGCHGIWKNVFPRWEAIRDKAKAVVLTNPTAVEGHPLDQGGIMDLADYLERTPYMCLLNSPGTSNFYFGRRNDPRNVCITPTKEQLTKSRKVARVIQLRDKRRGEGKYATGKTISVRKITQDLKELEAPKAP